MQNTDLHTPPAFPLTEEEAFVYYDGPMVFSAHDTKGRCWMLTAIPDQPDLASLVFLMIEIDEPTLLELTTRKLTLRDLYEKADKPVYMSGLDKSSKLSVRLAGELTDDVLPSQGYYVIYGE